MFVLLFRLYLFSFSFFCFCTFFCLGLVLLLLVSGRFVGSADSAQDGRVALITSFLSFSFWDFIFKIYDLRINLGLISLFLVFHPC